MIIAIFGAVLTEPDPGRRGGNRKRGIQPGTHTDHRPLIGSIEVPLYRPVSYDEHGHHGYRDYD